MSGRTLKAEELHLDLGRYELRRGGRVLRLERQPMELLILLAENRRELVTREQIVARLWDGHTFVDTERSINSAIRKIRLLLNEDADDPRFIETVVGKGYRFTGAIRISSRGTPPLSPQPQVAKETAEAAISAGSASLHVISAHSAGRRYRFAALLTISLLALVALVWIGILQRAKKQSSARLTQIHSLVVLPFENLSGDAGQDYLADGMTDELITDLARFDSFRVISRTSALTYRGVRKPLKAIAQELGVDAVLEGSIARSGNRVRVRAQLIDARTDQHRWAESYERDITDVVDLQTEIASSLSEQVSIHLFPSKQRSIEKLHHPRTAKAYEDYLKGWYFFDKRSPETARRSVEYFRKSIEQDPQFPLAYAGLAEALETLNAIDVAPYSQIEPEALGAVRRALELDPQLGEAHSALGLIEAQWNWNWPEAERQMKAALELSPGSALVHERYAMYLQAVGRVDQAVLEARRAVELDPLSFFINRELGRSLYLARRYDEAVQQLQRSEELYPNSGVVSNWLSWIAEKRGNYALAMQLGIANNSTSGPDAKSMRAFRNAYKARDWKRYCQAELHVNMTQWAKHPSAAFFIAEDEARLGDKDAAFKWMQKALDEKTVWVMWIKVDPLLDGLRSDPRFPGLLRRIGLT